MPDIFTVLKRLTRNDFSFLLHRLFFRVGFGNRLQQLANRDIFNRPEWFWARRSVPRFPLEQPHSSDELDLAAKRNLVRDLISSFEAAQKLDPDNRSYSPLWAIIINRSAQEVLTALREKNSA